MYVIEGPVVYELSAGLKTNTFFLRDEGEFAPIMMTLLSCKVTIQCLFLATGRLGPLVTDPSAWINSVLARILLSEPPLINNVSFITLAA